MPDTRRFYPHPASRLFADAVPVVSAGGVTGFQRIPAGPVVTALSQLRAALESECGFCVSDTAPPPGTETDADQFLTLTGGSSGAPKLVRRTQTSWIASFRRNQAIFDLTAADRVAAFGALSHSLTLYAVLEAMHLGMDAHVLEGLPPRRQSAALAQRGVSILYLTPSQLRLLVLAEPKGLLPHVRLILCGGGVLDAATQELATSLFPNARFAVFYGSAETSFVSLADGSAPAGSVGRAYPGVEIAVRDSERRPTQGLGEIWVRSPYLFDSYASAGADGAEWDGDYLSVGEIGRMDADGYLWIAGRKSRAINIADRLFYPEAMESFLAGCEGVAAAAVLSLPDRMRGRRLIAVIEGTPSKGDEERLREACAKAFGALFRPRAILFRPALPRLPSGKNDMAALTAWVRTQL